MNRRHAALAMVLVLVASFLPAVCQNTAIREYDWIIDIQLKELKNYANFAGSTLKPLFKATVTYHSTDPANENKQTQYEELFFRGCDAIGCRRLHTFDITTGDGVAIRIKTGAQIPVPQESCAASNAIVRLLLDAYLNSNSVVSVLLPQNIFGSVVQDLHRQNFLAAAEVGTDVPVYSSIVLHLQSEPSGQTQTMNYVGQTD